MSMDDGCRKKGSDVKKKRHSCRKTNDNSKATITNDSDDSENEGIPENVQRTKDKRKRTTSKSKDKYDDKETKNKYFDSFSTRSSFKDRRDRVTPRENIDNTNFMSKSNSFKDNKLSISSGDLLKKESFPPNNDSNHKKILLDNEISTFKYADGSEVRLFPNDIHNSDSNGRYRNDRMDNFGVQRVIAKMEIESNDYLDLDVYGDLCASERSMTASDTTHCLSVNTSIPHKFHTRSGSDVLTQLSKFNQPHLQDCVSAPSLNSRDAALQVYSTRGRRTKRGELRVVEPLISQESTKSSLAAVWGAKQEPLRKTNRKPNLSRKLSSWEERTNVERRRSLAGRGTATAHSLSSQRTAPSADIPTPIITPPITLAPYLDTKDLRYCFQHPYLRLVTTSSVIFCNFLMFAEDPISHSQAESFIPVAGNVFSFVFTKYPPDWRWALVKVLMWVLAILCGLVFGKVFIHDIIFAKYMRLKMFRDEQGSWILMFLTVIMSMYLFSHMYNFILFVFYNKPAYKIDSRMGISYATVMKAAVCGTWLGDLVTLLMVLDVMLQDSLYPNWAPSLRLFCRKSNIPRVVLFWVGSALATALVVTLVVTESLSWDALNRDLFSSTELSRAFLASTILVLDLVIMMQDWDFPHFTTTVHINLPGFSVSRLQWKYAEVNLTGKWFSYGVIFMVMLLDLNMWQNQIFYYPGKFGQYVGPDSKIRTVLDMEQIKCGNTSLTWDSRSKINPNTEQPYHKEDIVMNSRYMGYPLILKCTAFLPSIITLSIYLCLIYLYGRFPQIKEKVTYGLGGDIQASETESEDGISV